MPTITEAEKQWCIEYGEKIGVKPKIMPKWHDEVACVQYELEGSPQYHRLELRKFNNRDALNGWVAYLSRYAYGYAQGSGTKRATSMHSTPRSTNPGENRPQTPEEAVDEIVEVLECLAQQTAALAARLCQS